MGYIFGGGIIATHLKHDALNHSENYIHSAQIALQRFHNELLDVHVMSTKTLQIETDGFVKFADYFFDDLFQLGRSIPKFQPQENRCHVSKMMYIIQFGVYRINIIKHRTIYKQLNKSKERF